jgi:hypothetical protein
VVPTLPASQSSGTAGGSSSSGRTRGTSSVETTSGALTAPGTTVGVDPWAAFPGRFLPLLPDQPRTPPSITGSVLEQDPWIARSDAANLPIPDPDLEAAGVVDTQPIVASEHARAGGVVGVGVGVGRAPELRALPGSAVGTPSEPGPEASVQPPLTQGDVSPLLVVPNASQSPGTVQTTPRNVTADAASVGVESIPVETTLSEPPITEVTLQPPTETVAQPTPLAEVAVGFGAALALVAGAVRTRPGRRWIARAARWRNMLHLE